jgi:gamma-glutamyltranspeptidase/glutathione hydrolase
MRDSFEDHRAVPGRILLNDQTPAWVRKELAAMGYAADYRDRTSGPINAIFFDQEQNTMQGGSSDFGEDYGIAW